MLKKSKKICIGIASTSSPVSVERYQSAVQVLESEGYSCKCPLNPANDYGSKEFLFSTHSPEDRANALHELSSDPEVDIIMTVRGGFGAVEILPFLNFSLLKQKAKPLIGFSDTTVLLLAIYGRLSGNSTIVHGPCLSSFAAEDKSCEENLSYFKLLMESEVYQPSLADLESVCEGAASQGNLIGGNLSSLMSLTGTEYEPDYQGKILFLEDAGEKPHRIYRALLQLKLAGRLNGLQGVVFGRFSGCEGNTVDSPNLDDVIKTVFSEFDYPVLKGGAFGHQGRNLPLILGQQAKINNNALEIIGQIGLI